jgi:hypothetical protein
MPTQTRRDRWTWAVARAKSLHPTTRLFLSTCLARHMNGKGQVCWPRHKLAKEFGITERRVSAHIQKAKEAGWLIIVIGGVRGHTAEYEATFPEANRVTTPDTLSEPEKGDGYRHPKRVTSASPYPRNRVTRTSPQVVSTCVLTGRSARGDHFAPGTDPDDDALEGVAESDSREGRGAPSLAALIRGEESSSRASRHLRAVPA